MQTETTAISRWFAIRVKSRCEKLAAANLAAKGIEVFAAVAPQRRVWADRIRVVQMPLFPGYIFGRFDIAQWREVNDAAGVASIVTLGRERCAVHDSEIESLRKLVSSGIDVYRSQFLQPGVPIRVTHG